MPALKRPCRHYPTSYAGDTYLAWADGLRDSVRHLSDGDSGASWLGLLLPHTAWLDPRVFSMNQPSNRRIAL